MRRKQKLKASVCDVCFEKKIKGLLCERNKHFICNECARRYFVFYCEQIGILLNNTFILPCYINGCTSNPWCYTDILKILTANVITKYSQCASVGIATNEIEFCSKIVREIAEVLNVHCPHCSHVLDPYPDGCCSVSCPSCRTYFCWICFQICNSSNACHAHVSRCLFVPAAEKGNLFVTNAARNTMHRIHKILAVRRVMLHLDECNGSICPTKERGNERSNISDECIESTKSLSLIRNTTCGRVLLSYVNSTCTNTCTYTNSNADPTIHILSCKEREDMNYLVNILQQHNITLQTILYSQLENCKIIKTAIESLNNKLLSNKTDWHVIGMNMSITILAVILMIILYFILVVMCGAVIRVINICNHS